MTEPGPGRAGDIAEDRFLVTGALGCIGAWTCAALAEEGTYVIGFDLGENRSRLELAGVADTLIVRGDITDRAALGRALDEHGITHVVHLAALLLPMIKADPPHGTAVNVGGTVNVLDTAKTRGIQVAWASSIAVYSQADDEARPLPNDAPAHPDTYYGVHKLACEGLARVFWDDEGVPSIGLRPFVVYGPGRDTGLTASPSLAMAAAARGEDYRIAFGGRAQLQFAPDAGRIFAAAARAATEGARVFHLGGPAEPMEECAAAIEEAAPGVRIEYDAVGLPFPEEFDGSALEAALGPIRRTPLGEGVRRTVERLRAAGAHSTVS